MPIALPSALPPQLIESSAVPRNAHVVAEADFQGYHIHVLGDPSLDALPLAKLAEKAKNLSELVYLIGSAGYSLGYPAARPLYVLEGTDLYVVMELGHMSGVEGDKRLTTFFRGAVGNEPLTMSAFERGRMLGTVQADRLGLSAQPSFVDDGHGGWTLRLDTRDAPDEDKLQANFGNPGNRYVGPYIGGASASVADPWGNFYSASVQREIASLNDDQTGLYAQQDLGITRMTPLGAFGLSGRHVHFTYRNNGIDTDNTLTQFGGLWLYPIYTDLLRRWTLQVGVDQIDRTGTIKSSGATYFDEAYPAATLSLGYARSAYLSGNRRLSLTAGLTLGRGFGDDTPSLSNATLAYQLIRPNLGATLSLGQHYELQADASGQATKDAVPEAQQWVIGGVNNLTAYMPGFGIGDSGYRVRLQGSRKPTGDGVRLTPRVFVEYASARLRNPSQRQPDHTASAGDVGAGLDVEFGRWLSSGVAWAEPFARDGVDRRTADDSRAHIQFWIQLSIR